MMTCALCERTADPRHGIRDRDGNDYPLCDGCAPGSSTREDVLRVVVLCITRGRPYPTGTLRFGFHELDYVPPAPGV